MPFEHGDEAYGWDFIRYFRLRQNDYHEELRTSEGQAAKSNQSRFVCRFVLITDYGTSFIVVHVSVLSPQRLKRYVFAQRQRSYTVLSAIDV